MLNSITISVVIITNKEYYLLQVRASAVFVPEFANLQDEAEKYMFAYSIRMSLLPEGCIINEMTFSSCQLKWRRWIIRANEAIISDVNGEAVIGKVMTYRLLLFQFLL